MQNKNTGGGCFYFYKTFNFFFSQIDVICLVKHNRNIFDLLKCMRNVEKLMRINAFLTSIQPRLVPSLAPQWGAILSKLLKRFIHTAVHLFSMARHQRDQFISTFLMKIKIPTILYCFSMVKTIEITKSVNRGWSARFQTLKFGMEPCHGHSKQLPKQHQFH